MHVIIDFNCLSSCLSCLIKDSLGSVLFSEVQWLKHTHGKTPLSGIISTTDEHGLARIRGIYTQFADSTILHESTSKFRG